MAASSPNWDELRREARTLENELDVKLGNLAKMSGQLGRELDEGAAQRRGRGSSGDLEAGEESVPLVSGMDHMTRTLVVEVGDLLDKLEQVNNSMQMLVQQGVSVTVAHTVQRHREILHEYQDEYRKTKGCIDSAIERTQLFSGADAAGTGTNRQFLLRERTATQAASDAADEAIGAATASREGILSQRSVLNGITTKLKTVGNHFPQINNVINAVQRRKSRDQMIIAAIIAFCFFLTIYYLFLGD